MRRREEDGDQGEKERGEASEVSKADLNLLGPVKKFFQWIKKA